MTFFCDEGVERQVVERLRADGHEVSYVAEVDPGLSDDDVLSDARRLEAPLITNDKDFGELVFRQGLASPELSCFDWRGCRWRRKPEPLHRPSESTETS